MKIVIKIIKWVVLILIILSLGTALYISVGNRIFIGKIDDEICTYLEDNKLILNTNLTNFNQNIFDDSFFNNDIFLYGEVHGFAATQKIDFSLFTYLHKTAGIKYYLAEMDSIKADQLNNFLDAATCDTNLLKSIVHSLRKTIPQQSSREFYEKWIALYDYNKEQADSLKIEIIGLDKHPQDTNKIARDSAMMYNFIKNVKERKLEGKKFYGFLGFAHVLQSNVGERQTKYFAARLKNAGYNIKSFVNFTIDSDMFMPENPDFPTPKDESVSFVNSNGPLVVFSGINELEEVTTPNTITLFNLEGKNTPYNSNQKLMHSKAFFISGDITPSLKKTPTTSYFQYAFLIRNSKAARSIY